MRIFRWSICYGLRVRSVDIIAGVAVIQSNAHLGISMHCPLSPLCDSMITLSLEVCRLRLTERYDDLFLHVICFCLPVLAGGLAPALEVFGFPCTTAWPSRILRRCSLSLKAGFDKSLGLVCGLETDAIAHLRNNLQIVLSESSPYCMSDVTSPCRLTMI